MSLDPYDVCPCGSGKKLKFCCQSILGDMQKVQTLQENQQPRMALQILDQLQKSHAENTWIAVTRSTILMGEGKLEEARDCLARLLEKEPSHNLGIALYAAAMFAIDGFEGAKPAIHRAFQRCTRTYPDMVSSLAAGIGTNFLESRKAMAAREHFVLAMRFAPKEDRQALFMGLLEIDGSRSLPFPFRSVHQLARYSGSQEIEEQAEQAWALATYGCWDSAASLFGRLAEQESNVAELWLNTGLCRAWNGDEANAGEAFHRAAQLYSDYGRAVECETIAQLLDLNSLADQVQVEITEYTVGSVSRLLTLLDEPDWLVRMYLPSPGEQESPEELPVAIFHVLDRALPETFEETKSLSVDTVPNVLARFIVFDRTAAEDKPARAHLMGYEAESLGSVRENLEQAAKGEIEPKPDDGNADPMMSPIPQDLFGLYWQWHFPETISLAEKTRLERAKWDRAIDEGWLQRPLAGLGGKTPLEAVGLDELKVRLAAAVFVLDAFCDESLCCLDFAPLCERLKLELPKPIELTEETEFNSFSAMDLRRLSLSELSDSQLSSTMKRAILLRHSSFTYDVLMEALKRPDCSDFLDLDRVFLMLVELCHERYQPEEAYQWIEKGKEFAKTQKNAFEKLFSWEMRELAMRLRDTEDPALAPLLSRMMHYYVPKLPQFQEHLNELLAAHGVDPAKIIGEGIVDGQAGTGSTTGSGLWTPESANEPGSGEKKIWIPGQS